MDNLSNKLSVCVVIPMYNSETTIIRALKSVCSQTRLPTRVVVVDDGSTDNSAALVEQFNAPFALELITQENQGPAAARNTGIYHASEPLICFLDADDQWLETKLEKQLALYSGLKAAGHNIGIIDCYEQILSEKGKDRLCNRMKKGQHFKDFAVENIINGTSCVLAERASIIAIGGFDTDVRYAEDRWLWTQIAEFKEIHTVPEQLSVRHIAGSNITSNPTKYFNHKKAFVDKFLAKYQHQFTRTELDRFVFNSFYDFQRSFYIDRDYGNSMFVFNKMLHWSWKALFYNHGKATVRFLLSALMSLFFLDKGKQIESL